MKFPQLSYLLIEQEVAESQFKYERLLKALALPSNPLQIESVEGSRITISNSGNSNVTSFNIARVQETSTNGIEAIHDRMVSTKKHLMATIPLGLDDFSYKALSELGYSMFHCRSILYCSLENTGSIFLDQGRIQIEANSSVDGFDCALKVLRSFVSTEVEDFKRGYQSWLEDNQNAQLFVAKDDGEPVGIGILSWRGETGILSSGVVAPSHRGRGLQKSLINYRKKMAQELGIKVLYAPGVPPFSASEASLRGSGFDLLCTRSFWKMK